MAERPFYIFGPGEGQRHEARGSVMCFKATAQTTGGRLSLMERTLPPGGRMPPAHVHVDCDEVFYVLQGQITFVLDGQEFPSAVRVKTPSRLVYDISSRGFTRLRGVVGLENVSNLAQGETILGRFLIFGTEPDMDRLVPPTPGTPATLADIIAGCLAKDPSARPRITEVAARLRDVLDQDH